MVVLIAPGTRYPVYLPDDADIAEYERNGFTHQKGKRGRRKAESKPKLAADGADAPVVDKSHGVIALGA